MCESFIYRLSLYSCVSIFPLPPSTTYISLFMHEYHLFLSYICNLSPGLRRIMCMNVSIFTHTHTFSIHLSMFMCSICTAAGLATRAYDARTPQPFALLVPSQVDQHECCGNFIVHKFAFFNRCQDELSCWIVMRLPMYIPMSRKHPLPTFLSCL